MRRKIGKGIGLTLILVGVAFPEVADLLGDRETRGSLAFAQQKSQSTKKLQPSRTRRRRRSSRRRSRERMISARPGALIPPARVVEIQQALIKRNYLQAPPTGVYDAATVSAMKAFQTAHKLEPTGYPTAQALDRLGLPPGPELSTPGDGPTERQSSSNSIGPASSGNKIPPQRQQR